jgi:hypothetical protein
MPHFSQVNSLRQASLDAMSKNAAANEVERRKAVAAQIEKHKAASI